MTQNSPDGLPSPVTPAQAVARRVREVRTLRGWSAQELARRCEALGMASLDRSTIAAIEIGRRKRIGVDELLVLALALGVAPLHLLIPLEEEWYAVTPSQATGASRARQWARGNYFISSLPQAGDPRERDAARQVYEAQRPIVEWEPPTDQERQQSHAERIQRLLEMAEDGLVTVQHDEDKGTFIVEPTDSLEG